MSKTSFGIKTPQMSRDYETILSCRQCGDFKAEYADISVGAIGSASGYYTIIARTEKSLELVKQAEKAGYIELRELAQKARVSRKF